MSREINSPVSRTEKQLETVLIVSFEGDVDDQPRRIRYLACRGEEAMWRVEERRCGRDWQTVETEPIEDLQMRLREQNPETERYADAGV
jgi:hypothetical protein